MGRFVYFVPGATHAFTVAMFHARGLSHAITRPPAMREVSHGPSGQAGMIVCEPSVQDAVLGYYADRQTWRQMPGGDVWIGFDRADRPTPEGLKRPDAIGGHPVVADDGEAWLVPLARRYDDDLAARIALPQKLDYDASGELVFDGVVARYARLWEIAEAWLETRRALHEHEGTLPDGHPCSERLAFGWAVPHALECLAVNYRIGRFEAAMLGMLTTSFPFDILNAVIDEPGMIRMIEARLKKNRADATPTTSVGEPD